MADAQRKGFRVHRYHAALHVGHALTTRSQRQEPVEVHLRQSSADSACALHCAAMCLIALGLCRRSAILVMSQRKYGVAADLYEFLGFSWLEGAFAKDVVEALEAMELPIAIDWKDGFDRGVDAFAVESLKKGRLTLLAYESTKNRHRHFVLGIGCGGHMVGQKFTVDSLLVLDPSTDALALSCCNGVLSIDKLVVFERRKSSLEWQYASAGETEPVRLMSAISVVRNDGRLAPWRGAKTQ
jgi:hypothetical protein